MQELGRSTEGRRDSAPRVVSCRHRRCGWRGCTGAAPAPGPQEASRCSLVRAPRTPELCLWPLEKSIQPQPLCPASPSEDRLPPFICGRPQDAQGSCSQGWRWGARGGGPPGFSSGQPSAAACAPAPRHSPRSPCYSPAPPPGGRALLGASPPAPCSPCSAQAKLLFLEVSRRGPESSINTYIQPCMTS